MTSMRTNIVELSNNNNYRFYRLIFHRDLHPKPRYRGDRFYRGIAQIRFRRHCAHRRIEFAESAGGGTVINRFIVLTESHSINARLGTDQNLLFGVCGTVVDSDGAAEREDDDWTWCTLIYIEKSVKIGRKCILRLKNGL